MQLIHTAEFLRSYEKLPPEIRVQTDKQLIFLSRNPRHPSLHVHKRAGERNLWQARMTRSYRLFFRMDGDAIVLPSVEPHEK